MNDPTKTIVAGAPFDLPLRCRFGWHRWTKWGEAVSLRIERWNALLGAREPDVASFQASSCADCSALRRREVP